MHQRALKDKEKLLERGYPNTLTSVDNLGLIL